MSLAFTYPFPFRVSSLIPASGQSMGAYGFSIDLGGDLVTQALARKMPDGHRLNDLCKMLIERVQGGDTKYVRPPLTFAGDTMLLTHVQVKGDACTLDIDTDYRTWGPGDSLYRAIGYRPHNVDSCSQAYALLGCWNIWYDLIACVIAEEMRKVAL